jgi:hypothetical protein
MSFSSVDQILNALIYMLIDAKKHSSVSCLYIYRKVFLRTKKKGQACQSESLLFHYKESV